MNLNKHCVQNINIVIFDGRKHSKYDLLVMGNDLVDQSDYEDTVEQADYIFCEERSKLIRSYIEKLKQFKINTLGRQFKNDQETYEERVIKKLISLFETELSTSEHLCSETTSLPPLAPKTSLRKEEQ